MAEAAEAILFTDGACSGNPGPGGWAFILRHVPTGKELRGSGGLAETTNNQMELTGVIEGLRALKKPTHIKVVSDSQYVVKGMREWVAGWIKHGWMRGPKKRDPVKNVELWKQLVELDGQHTVEYEYVKGHAGHAENEECDQMAVEAARQAAMGLL